MGLINRFLIPRVKSLAAAGRLGLMGHNHIQASDLFAIERGGGSYDWSKYFT